MIIQNIDTQAIQATIETMRSEITSSSLFADDKYLHGKNLRDFLKEKIAEVDKLLFSDTLTDDESNELSIFNNSMSDELASVNQFLTAMDEKDLSEVQD